MANNWKSGMKSGVLVGLGMIVACAGCPQKVPVLPHAAPAPLHRPRELQAVVAVDKDGSQVLAGSFGGRLSIGGKELTSEGGTDIYVAKIGANGAPIFGPERFGGPGDDAVTGIAIDTDGSVVLVGTFQGEATFRDQKKKADARHPGQRAIFVAKVDAMGKISWVSQVAVANLPTQVSLAIRPDHKILVGASTTGTVATKKEQMTLSGESVMLALVDAQKGGVEPTSGGAQYQVLSYSPGCAHSPCRLGAALDPTCGWYGCVAAVCDKYSWCCTNVWNYKCYLEFLNSCQRRCDCNQVFTAGPAFYPDASLCVSEVYSLGTGGGGIGDTYCTEVEWDGICVAETDQLDITAACHPPCQ